MKNEDGDETFPGQRSYSSFIIHNSAFSAILHPFFNVLAETSECMNPQSGAELRQYR